MSYTLWALALQVSSVWYLLKFSHRKFSVHYIEPSADRDEMSVHESVCLFWFWNEESSLASSWSIKCLSNVPKTGGQSVKYRFFLGAVCCLYYYFLFNYSLFFQQFDIFINFIFLWYYLAFITPPFHYLPSFLIDGK